MRKLLRADFARLKVSKTFWLTLAGLLAVCFYLIFDIYTWKMYHPDVEQYFENDFFNYAAFLGFCCAIIVGMVTGSDYSDGTIRNKLIVGSERWRIYFSHLIVTCAVSVTLVIVWCVPMLAIGLPLSDGFHISNGQVVALILLSVLTTIAFGSICLAITLGMQNRTAAVIVAFVVMMVLFCGSMVINGKLNQPEMYAPYVITMDGVQTAELEPNPHYIGGTQREIYQWIDDTLPSGQTIQMANGADPEHMGRWPFTSALVILLSSAIGCAIFERKDIK